MSEIVISYRREDIGDAGRLADRLGSYFGPDRVFIDTSSLSGGVKYSEVISAAIRDSTVVLVVVGPNWRNGLKDPDDWVRREVREALSHGRAIVPVQLHDTPLPEAAALPDDIRGLAERNVLPIDDHYYDEGMKRLTLALEGLGVGPKLPAPFIEVPAQGHAESRIAWVEQASLDDVRKRLRGALARNDIEVTPGDGDTELLSGGSQPSYHLLGAPLVSESKLPIRGMLRLRERAGSTVIELLLCDRTRDGVVFPKGRFESRFAKLIAALRPPEPLRP